MHQNRTTTTKKSKTRKGTFTMSETTKTAKTAEERLAIRDERIKQLQKQKQKIRKDENKKIRKQRDNRLYRRHGLLEKFMPKIIDITDEQFEVFIRKGINTTYGRNCLNEIIDKGEEAAIAYVAKFRAKEEANADAKSSEPQADDGTDDSANSLQAVSSGA